MIKRAACALFCGAALIAASTQPVRAQLKMAALFIVPETLDPNESVTFSDMSTHLIGADDLLEPVGFPMVKGLEIHSTVPGTHGGILDVDKFEMSFLFDGTFTLNSVSNPPFTIPWTVTDTASGRLHTLTFTRFSLSGPMNLIAPINDNLDPGPGDPFHKSFGSLTFSPFDTNSEQNFLDDNLGDSISVTPLLTGQERTPEPGAVAYLAATASIVGVVGLRRRRLHRR